MEIRKILNNSNDEKLTRENFTNYLKLLKLNHYKTCIRIDYCLKIKTWK